MFLRGYGGIGIHGCLKNNCRKAWGFESLYPYHLEEENMTTTKGKKLIKNFKEMAEASAYDNERVGGEEAEETYKLYKKAEQDLIAYITDLELQ